ncbi:MAG: hypothetical protein ACRENJ_01920 [Candidatus Eiseniibacteriota bacterium]
MNPVVRGILAVIAGMLVAFVLIVVVQTIGTRIYPPPPMDRTNIDSIKAAMAQIPLASLLFVLLSYAAGSVAGGWVAARFAPRDKMAHAMTLAALLFCLGIMNLISLPHPPWFWVASSAIYWLGAWSGAKAAGA